MLAVSRLQNYFKTINIIIFIIMPTNNYFTYFT